MLEGAGSNPVFETIPTKQDDNYDMHCLLFNFNRQLSNNARALGCYRIAHFIRDHGWDVEVIEYAAYWSLDKLKELAQQRISKQTQWIGTSHMFSVWGKTMEEFCLWIKQEYPWIKIISGSSVNPMFPSRSIDFYIQGYGEYALLELLKYLFSNGEKPKFDILSAGGRKVIPAIRDYPAYPLSSLMVKYQDRDFILPGEWLGIEFSRGCKFACAHCNYPIIGVKYDTTRDSKDFYEQVMDAYDRWGVQGYYVADETFNDRTEKITKFADVVETLPFEIWFSGYIRPDLIVSRIKDREELARMNFRGHFYGIESFNQAAARAIGKGMNPDRLKEGIVDVKKYFQQTGNGLYRADMSFIIGLPRESISDIENTLSWLDDHWFDQRFAMNVLQLWKTDIDKPSELSVNYKKYGYEEMSAEEIEKEMSYGRHPNSIYARYEQDLSRNLIWKNPQMNMFDAGKIEQEIYEKYNSQDQPTGRAISMWRLASVILHEHSVEQRLKIDPYEMKKLIANKQDLIINDYIDKKLSL